MALFNKSAPKKTGSVKGEHCRICNTFIPLSALHCEICGPPDTEHAYSNKNIGLDPRQTIIRILVIVLVFSVMAVIKLDISLKSIFTFEGSGEQTEKPKDDDFQLGHVVNVPLANVRSKPSTSGKILLTLEKGTKVIILKEEDGWAQIKVGEKTGWIGKRLLTASIG